MPISGRSCVDKTRKSKLSTVRTRILDAAQVIIDTQGLGQLTQPKIAKAAGVRQSHLTYYFRRRTDLLSALLEHSHHGAEHDADAGDFASQLVRLLFDTRRARFFLAVIVETSETPEGREAMAMHMAEFASHVAAHFGRELHDEEVLGFVAEMRGLSMQNLVAPVEAPRALQLIRESMSRHALFESDRS